MEMRSAQLVAEIFLVLIYVTIIAFINNICWNGLHKTFVGEGGGVMTAL